jgi:hypothetical protein
MAKTRQPKVVLSSYSCGGASRLHEFENNPYCHLTEDGQRARPPLQALRPYVGAYPGIDHSVFNTVMRTSLRGPARKELAPGQFAVILVGNDWRNKAVVVLLEALERLRDLPIALLIVSREESSPWWKLVTEIGLEKCVHLLPPRKDIEFYYAAADVHAALPSKILLRCRPPKRWPADCP